MSVLVAGNSVLDIHARAPEGPEAFGKGWEQNNVRFLNGAPATVLGGNGAATSYALGKLGVRVGLNTALGDDAFGRLVKGWLNEANVQLVSKLGATTAVNFVQSRADDGARMSLFYTGDRIDWATGIDRDDYDWFFASGYGCVSEADFLPLVSVFAQVQSCGKCVAFDPGPWFARSVPAQAFREAVAEVDCLTATEEELATWSQRRTVNELVNDFIDLGVSRVVVKQGEAGATFAERAGAPDQISGNPVRGAHAVGAGDTFNGALLAGLSRGESLEDCVRVAVATAEQAVRSGRGVLGAFD